MRTSKKFVDSGRGQALLNAVAGRFVFDSGHRDHMDRFRQNTGAASNVITASREDAYDEAGNQLGAIHSSSFSANFTAFDAGKRILSAAAQNTQAPAGGESGWRAAD